MFLLETIELETKERHNTHVLIFLQYINPKYGSSLSSCKTLILWYHIDQWVINVNILLIIDDIDKYIFVTENKHS